MFRRTGPDMSVHRSSGCLLLAAATVGVLAGCTDTSSRSDTPPSSLPSETEFSAEATATAVVTIAETPPTTPPPAAAEPATAAPAVAAAGTPCFTG